MGLIPEETIAQVIDRTDIAELIAAYVPLKRAGRNFKACCPFHHEKTPSFIVNPDKQIFHCFGCGVGGNVLTFVMKQERLEFPDAIRMLAGRVNVTIPEDRQESSTRTNERQQLFAVNQKACDYFHRFLLSSTDPLAKRARSYLKGRGVDLAMVKQFQVGCAPDRWDGLSTQLTSDGVSLRQMEAAGLIIPRDNGSGFYDRFRARVMFPIFDTRGQCRAFGGRVFDQTKTAADTAGAKYINSPETAIYTKGHHLYGFHLAKHAIAQVDRVIVVEGYMDCLMVAQAGIANVVASQGTALTLEQVRLIRRYTHNIILLFDADDAGESAMFRSLDMLLGEGMDVHVASLAQGEDPDTFIRTYGVDRFKQALDEAGTVFEYKLLFLTQQYDSTTPTGKAHIADGMLPTIAKIPHAVIQGEYLSRLATRLQVPESALVAEMRKIPLDQPARQSTDRPVVSFVQEQMSAAERNLLKLLLEDPCFIPSTKETIAVHDVQDADIRNVITRIYELFEQGKPVNDSSLINSFEDERVQHLISCLVASDEIIGDKKKMHTDCMRRIKEDRQKVLRQAIVEQMKAAEQAREFDKLATLAQQFKQLLT